MQTYNPYVYDILHICVCIYYISNIYAYICIYIYVCVCSIYIYIYIYIYMEENNG